MNPLPPAIPDETLIQEIFEAQGKSFRGGVLENLGAAPMRKGHGNDGKPFDIETACYLKPIFAEYDKAVQNGTRLKLVLKAGVKTVKSFALEACAADHVCNRNGDCAIYFGTESAAETTATTRILDFLKGDDMGGGIARFRQKMATIRSRFDETIGALKFPDKTLFILSANLGNTQQKNLGMVGLQDAFVTGTTGMIAEMIARTTQYEKEAIVFLESQGGEKGFDFDTHYEDTDQRELHTCCPLCGTRHLFNWKAADELSMTRPEDFQAVLPFSEIRRIEEETNGEWNDFCDAIEEARKALTQKLTAAGNRVAGFNRGPDELVKKPNGELDEAAVLRETHFQCFHCGGTWRDDGEFGPTRMLLDLCSHYVAARKDALPYNIGFNVPQWINRRLLWGPMLLQKLKAQATSKSTGNYEPIKQWWQKTAGRTWDPDFMAHNQTREVSTGSYETDPEKLMPEFHSRNMAVDCQKDLRAGPNEDRVGSFWVIVREYDKHGNSRQLARGFLESWDDLVRLQKFWKIPNQRVAIDSSHWTPQIMLKAAMEFEMVLPMKAHPLTGRKDPYPSCWRLFFGDARADFKINGKSSAFSEGQPSPPFHVTDKDGRKHTMRLFKYRWSNIAFEMQLDAILSKTPGMPRFEVLARDQLPPEMQAKESGILTYEQQLNARYLTKIRGKPFFADLDNREAHYRDCELMLLVRAAQDGLLGHVAPVLDVETDQ